MTAKLLSSPGIVTVWIVVDRFVRAAMNAQVGLLVTHQASKPNPPAALNRVLGDSARFIFPERYCLCAVDR